MRKPAALDGCHVAGQGTIDRQRARTFINRSSGLRKDQLKYEVEQRQRYFLTKDEETALMQHNLHYQQLSGLGEMLLSLFEKPDGTPKKNPENGYWISVKEISARLKETFKGAYKPDDGTLVKIGQFLNRPEYKFENDRKSHGWCYWVKDR